MTSVPSGPREIVPLTDGQAGSPAPSRSRISGKVSNASPITPMSTSGIHAIISRGSDVSTPPPSKIVAFGHASRATATICLIEP